MKVQITDRDEETFRIKPGKIRREQPQQVAKASKAFRKALSKSRLTGSPNAYGSGGARRLGPPNEHQRVAVRVTYATNPKSGGWKAHGKYMEREGAQITEAEKQSGISRSELNQEVGFSSNGEAVSVSNTIGVWADKAADDENLFKVIISPEFSEGVDLKKMTREVMSQMERDLAQIDMDKGGEGKARRLEWIAAVHINTDNPHVHVAIRGVDADGQRLVIPPSYIKEGFRMNARRAVTRQLGYRTEQDHIEALQRQVEQHRFTDIDRALIYDGKDSGRIITNVRTEHAALRKAKLRRLAQLQNMGLAEKRSAHEWQLSSALETSLRQMQISSDIQKTKALHRKTISDPALPMAVTNLRQPGTHVAGRVVGAGLDDRTDRPYLMVEGFDGRVHFMDQPTKLSMLRGSGDLVAGDYVSIDVEQLKGLSGRNSVRIQNFGRTLSPAHIDNELLHNGEAITPATMTHTQAGKFRQAAIERIDRLQRAGAIELTGNKITLRDAVALDHCGYEDMGIRAENYTSGHYAGQIVAKGKASLALADGSSSHTVITADQLRETGYDLRYAKEGAYLIVKRDDKETRRAIQIHAKEVRGMVSENKTNKLDELHGMSLKDGHPLKELQEQRAAVWNKRGIDTSRPDWRYRANTWSRSMKIERNVTQVGLEKALKELSRETGKPVVEIELKAGAQVSGRIVLINRSGTGAGSTVVLDNGRELAKLPVNEDIKIAVGQRVRATAQQAAIANETRRIQVWRFADLERSQLKGKAKGRAF